MAFGPMSFAVGVAILSATALLLLITVIVSIPTLCLITRWVYTTMHSSMHYARVSVACAPPPSLYVYTCPPLSPQAKTKSKGVCTCI